MSDQHILLMQDLGCMLHRISHPSKAIPHFDEVIHGDYDAYDAHPDYDGFKIPYTIEEYTYKDFKLIFHTYYDPDSDDNTPLVAIHDHDKIYDIGLYPFDKYGDCESLTLILQHGIQAYIDLISYGHKLATIDSKYEILEDLDYIMEPPKRANLNAYYWKKHFQIPIHETWRYPFVKATDQLRLTWTPDRNGLWCYDISASYRYRSKSHGRRIDLKEVRSISYSIHNLRHVLKEIDFLITLITKPWTYGVTVHKNGTYRFNPTLIVYVLDQMSYSYIIDSLTIQDYHSFKLGIKMDDSIIIFEAYYDDYDRFNIHDPQDKLDLKNFYSFFQI